MPDAAAHDPAVLDDLERSLASVVRLLGDRAITEDLAAQSGVDLPPASWALIEHLQLQGPLRVSDIAACHGVDVSSITPRLKRLEQAGLVARERSSADARVFLISLTDAGAQALGRMHAARREILLAALVDIDPRHVADTAGVLGCIAKHLAGER